MTKMKEATSGGKKRGIDQVIEKDNTDKLDNVQIKEKNDSGSTNAKSENIEIDLEVC